jgi:hypothetical protein
VDYDAERPALARILPREVADATPTQPPPLLAHARPFVELVERFRAEVRDDPLVQARPIDPVHLASAIVGTTVFFVAAMPTLVPAGSIHWPRSPGVAPQEVPASRGACSRPGAAAPAEET